MINGKLTEINILGKMFTLSHPKQVDAQNSYGETDGAERTIKIRAGLGGELYADTVLHEILHAILYVSGQTFSLDEKQEEGIVIALENGLSQIMPELMDLFKSSAIK